MKPNILTRERLNVIEEAIEKHSGSVSVRFLLRNHFIQRNIVDEAVEQGFIKYVRSERHTGRPSLIVKKVSTSPPTKLPPLLDSLEAWISFRHWDFAFYYILGEFGSGNYSFSRKAYRAYLKTYPSARSKAGARASASRLLKKPHIQAAIQWQYACYCDRETDCRDYHPKTATEVWEALIELGSWRVRCAPFHIRMNYTV